MKIGNAALKKVHDVLNIDEIEKILDETREGIEKQKEIDDLISGQLTEEDEEAVEAELEEILDTQQDLPEVPTDELPEVPETKVSEKEKHKTKEKVSRIALEA